MDEQYYTVLVTGELADLINEVNKLIREDRLWKPAGGIFVHNGVWAQAMYRDPAAVRDRDQALHQPEYGRMTPRDAALQAALAHAAWEALPEDQK